MKHWKIILICILCVIPAVAIAANAPSLTLDRTEHDFGEVPSGQHVQTRFVVSNTGDAVLIIDDVRTSCGCTSAVVGSRQVPPGGSTQITVTYDTSDVSPGNKRQGVMIHCNDPMRPTAQLEIHVNVVQQ